MKYYTQNFRSTASAFHAIVAKLSGVELGHEKATDEQAKLLFSEGNTTLLRIDEATSFRDEVSIGKYLARTGGLKDQLLGTTIFDESKISQWLSWTDINIRFTSEALLNHLTGKATEGTLDFKAANGSIRASMKFLNTQLKDKKTLVGENITIADVYLATHLVRLFQLLIEAGFRKGIANVVAWFTNITSSDAFKANFGSIKLAARPMKPFVKAVSKDQKDKGGKKGNKNDKKGGKGDKKQNEDFEEEKITGIPDDAEFADPIYGKYKGIFKNATWGKVVTRFPPEPSGFLHIGHIKASMLNYHYSKIYNGKMILRFDDTNPSKEKIEFVENIKKDLKTVGITPWKTTYTSDYFDQLQDKMRKFIEMGMAYADDTPGDQMKEERDAGIESKNKGKTPKETIEIFEKMLEGKAEGWCIRANLNMQDKSKCLRDPVMYRCNTTPHHKTKTKYKAYPTYDFACPIVDALEGVTNCLRTIEYRERDPLYHLIQEKLGFKQIEIFEYAKLQLKSTLMSKRKLQWFVDEGKVEGWYDPRFPTVQGLMRRGLTVQTLKEFMLDIGASIKTTRMEWDKLWAFNKQIIDKDCKRYFTVLTDSSVEVSILNGPETPEGKTVKYHFNNPDLGEKTRILTNSVFIEREDVADLKVGDKFALKDWGMVYIKTVEEVDGKLKLAVELNFDDTKFGKKIKKATFVASDPLLHVPVTIYEFGHLITKDNLKEEDNVEDFVNENSKIKSTGYAEKDIANAKEGDLIQIERRGYFYVDKDLESHKEIVLHFIPDGKTKNMSAISSKIDNKVLTKGEGDIAKGANRAEEAKLKEGDDGEPKKLTKKLAKKQKKAEHKAAEGDTKE
ncbi:unnamed protein product [Moneuplotes crassus]|uniref:glutamate--tRNA ligase n=1 Tax=Euplotes crassus TaxID=5936 RepID=A0AAD1Y4T9_EUPCR|nr:unnamed protein product [Moneuplotes crassus]